MTFSLQAEQTVDQSFDVQEKEEQLRSWMRHTGSLLVAYSGGVDSSYLAYVASSEIGQNALCVLGISPSVSGTQREEAASIAEDFGFRFRTIQTEEFADPAYVANPNNRCYFCKSELFEKMIVLAAKEGITTIVDGTNFDDVGGHRPGRRAAEENGVRSPLVDFGFTKSDIRELSRKHGLPTWDKPASPCLSSRIAYGVPVTIERLTKVEKGESLLRKYGFREFRLRVHGELARIEVSPDEFDRILDRRIIRELSVAIQSLGFKFVTLDLHGYRSGALNEELAGSKDEDE